MQRNCSIELPVPIVLDILVQVLACCVGFFFLLRTDVLNAASFSLIVTNLSTLHYLDKLKEQISWMSAANKVVPHNALSNVFDRQPVIM